MTFQQCKRLLASKFISSFCKFEAMQRLSFLSCLQFLPVYFTIVTGRLLYEKDTVSVLNTI